MCPLCVGTAALLASGGTSAGGLTALLLRQRTRRRVAKFVGALRMTRPIRPPATPAPQGGSIAPP